MFNCFRKKINNIRIHKALPNIGTNYSICESFVISGGNNISIGNNFAANINLRIQAINNYAGKCFEPQVIILDNVTMGQRCHIGCINKVVIGNGVLMGSNILIIDHQHGSTTERSLIPPKDRELISKGPIIIEDSVWIGDNVAIMPNVTIGEGSIIGSNTVVTKNVPAYSVVAGNPAKIIRELV